MPYFMLTGFVSVAFAIGLMYSGIVRARLRSAIIFRHIGNIIEQNVPMGVGLYYASLGERGVLCRILMDTSRFVQAGMPLSQALTIAYPGCSSVAMTTLKAAETSGTLPSAIGELNQRFEQKPLHRSDVNDSRWLLLCSLAVFFILVLYAVQYYLGPRLQVIWADFGGVVPDFTQELTAAMPFSSASPTTLWGRTYKVAVTLLGLTAPVLFLWAFFRAPYRRVRRLRIVSSVVDCLRWHIWPWRAVAIAESCVGTIPVIRLSAVAGWPLADAISQAATVDTNVHWQQRLEDWSTSLAGGADPVTAGRDLGVPEMLLRYMAAGIRDGDLDSALYQAEKYYTVLLHRWHSLVFQMFWPLATISMGVLVGMFCLANILGIKCLLDHVMAQSIYGP